MGVAGIEIFIPPERLKASDISAASGIPLETIAKKRFREKPILAEGIPIYTMGLIAAEKLLNRMNVKALDIGVLVYAGSGLHDHRFWSPAAKLQNELNLGDCFCLDISCGCHAGNYALGVVENHLATSPGKRYGLIVNCDALSRVVDHADPEHVSIFNFADAASAILIDRECRSLRLLGQSSLTDGRFSDYLKLGRNGKLCYLRADLRAELKQAYENNFPRVIREAARVAGKSIDSIQAIFISQGDPQLFEHLARVLEIDARRLARTSIDFGHLGGSDIFFGLKSQIDEGKLRTGDLVILASSAIGFSWGASVIEI